MITANMDADTIHQQIMADVSKSVPWMQRKKKEHESMRTNRLCFNGYEWMNRDTHNKYLVTFCSDMRADRRSTLSYMCEIDTDKGKAWARTTLGHRRDTVIIYTSHYFKRYAERCGSKRLMPGIIHEYNARNQMAYTIWWNDDLTRAVMATETGLALCSIRNKVFWANTFVSKDMLKGTQLEAYNLTSGHIGGFADLNRKLQRMGDIDYRDSSLNAMLLQESLVCRDIYNRFYEEDEE